MSEFVVITGLSGAGRSLAADDLEDLGWFVIDNLPPGAGAQGGRAGADPGLVDRAGGAGGGHRPPTRTTSCPCSAWLRSAGARVRVLFLEASTDALVRRYDNTRRRHPLSGGGDTGTWWPAIERERTLLEPVKAEADVVVDTSDLNIHALRRRVKALFRRRRGRRRRCS